MTEYNWYFREADLLDITTLERHGLLPTYVSREAEDISIAVREGGVFTPELKQRALAVVAEVRKYDTALKGIRLKEQEEYENQPDIPDVKQTDDTNCFGVQDEQVTRIPERCA